MRRSKRALPVSIAAVAVAATVGFSVTATAAADGPYQRPGVNERLSVSSTGAQGSGVPLIGSGPPADGVISADGRYVAFSSDHSNLVPGDTNRWTDVFRRDRRTRKTIRVSVASDGSQSNPIPGVGGVVVGSISADGRYIAFASSAPNLVPGDTNLDEDVFVRDVEAGKTTRVSVSTTGAQGNGSSGPGALSADGRYIAFDSNADNLVTGDANKSWDVFVRNLRTGRTSLVSRSSTGVQGNDTSGWASLSASGRYLAFTSHATNLVPDRPVRDASAVFWRDLKTGKTRLASVASDGSPASFASLPSCTVVIPTLPAILPVKLQSEFRICLQGTPPNGGISADGRLVFFTSNATNLVPNDTNYGPVTTGLDSYMHDVTTGRTERTSVDSYGRQRSIDTYQGALSQDGRFVIARTRSTAAGAACGSTPTGAAVGVEPFGCSNSSSEVHDRLSGATETLAVSASGRHPRPGPCTVAERTLGINVDKVLATAISPGGRHVVLFSPAQDLVRGDSNGLCDVFVRDRGRAAGVGGFGGSGSGSNPGPGQTCVAVVCLPPLTATDARADARAGEADLIRARVVPRPQFGDLYVRLDVARMAAVADVPAGGLLYGVAFSANGVRYEVRAQRVAGVDFDPNGGASFGLFRQDPATGLWSKVAALKGGYGTTGNSLVAGVPIRELGLTGGGGLTGIKAFTGVGSYLTGATRVLDFVRLTR